MRAASTNVTSFISVSACSGVLVRVSRTEQASRPEASKVIIDGGAIVRFQNVYRLRRYKLCAVILRVRRRRRSVPSTSRAADRD